MLAENWDTVSPPAQLGMRYGEEKCGGAATSGGRQPPIGSRGPEIYCVAWISTGPWPVPDILMCGVVLVV